MIDIYINVIYRCRLNQRASYIFLNGYLIDSSKEIPPSEKPKCNRSRFIQIDFQYFVLIRIIIIALNRNSLKQITCK